MTKSEIKCRLMPQKALIWFRGRVRKWLGLGEMFTGVDVGTHDQTTIVICSRLGDGRIKIIDTRFHSLRELESAIRDMQGRYGIHDSDIIADLPRFGPSEKQRRRYEPF